MNSILDQIGQFALQLLALGRQKNPIELKWRKYCQQDSTFPFDPIFVKLAGNQDRHKTKRFLNAVRSDFLLWSYLPLGAIIDQGK